MVCGLNDRPVCRWVGEGKSELEDVCARVDEARAELDRLVAVGIARGPLTLTARMNYRKFSWWNTQFAYAGVRDPEVQEYAVSPHFDDGPFVFTGDTSTVSGAIKAIPGMTVEDC